MTSVTMKMLSICHVQRREQIYPYVLESIILEQERAGEVCWGDYRSLSERHEKGLANHLF